MTVVVGGSSPQITFADSTVQNTAALPLTGGSVSADITVHGLTVGLGAGADTGSVVVGASSLSGSNTGTNNIAIGSNVLSANTSGSRNTSVGKNSLVSNTTGSSNSALGVAALDSNTTGNYNVAVGDTALLNSTTASNNTAVGYQALYNSTGASNIAIGYQSGYNIVAGANNLCIGYYTRTSGSGDGQELVISTNTSGSVGKGSNTGFIDPNGGGVYQTNNSLYWAQSSDQRLKKNIVDNTVGLIAINEIKIRNFEYRLPEEITDLDKSNAVNITGTQLGVIAQELQTVLPDCVKTESTGVMSIDATNITWHLINAVKELSAEVTALKAKVGA